MKLITDFLENSSRKFPNKTALIFKADKYTYAELQTRVQNFSSFVNKFQKNSVISIFFDNSPEFIIAYLGILKSACIAHIIPSNISQTNLNEQVFSAKPKSIISSKEFFPMISKI